MRKVTLLAGGACFALVLVLGVKPAMAQVTCPNTVPWPLTTFCADSPAIASQVNGNFTQVMALIAQRTGPVDAGVALPPNAVVGSNLVDGTITAPDLAPASVTTVAIADSTITEAKLNAVLGCPDVTSRTNYGQCIFYRGGPTGNIYVYNLRQAATVCKGEFARLCTVAELHAAWAAGLQNCAYGWLADGAGPSTGTAGFPMQTVVSGCGGIGVSVSGGLTATNNYGAWCCK